jgi:hypothetical protein
MKHASQINSKTLSNQFHLKESKESQSFVTFWRHRQKTDIGQGKQIDHFYRTEWHQLMPLG